MGSQFGDTFWMKCLVCNLEMIDGDLGPGSDHEGWWDCPIKVGNYSHYTFYKGVGQPYYDYFFDDLMIDVSPDSTVVYRVSGIDWNTLTTIDEGLDYHEGLEKYIKNLLILL